jgi:cytochrome P450
MEDTDDHARASQHAGGVVSMRMTETPLAFPFGEPDRLEVDESYRVVMTGDGLVKVRMRHGEPAWLVSRYADVKLVLGDRRFSRAMAIGRDAPRMYPMPPETNLLTMDPPEHGRLRTLLAKAFTQRRVETLRPRIRELAGTLTDGLLAHGAPVDLVEHFALPLPVAVICELLGVPMADRARFRGWTDTMMSTTDRPVEEMRANQAAMHAYLAELLDRHRVEPADDLMSALIEASDERGRLTPDELLSLCALLLVAGHETTATQIPNFVYVLLEHPDAWARLVADPGLIPVAVEELMRFVPAVEGAIQPHYATEDVEIGATLVRAGEPVLVALAAANRDPRRFEDPDELRLDRRENQHVGFGHGAHHCLGAQLARAELQESLLALTSRLPGLHIADDPGWKSEVVVRGVLRLPVAW